MAYKPWSEESEAYKLGFLADVYLAQADEDFEPRNRALSDFSLKRLKDDLHKRSRQEQ